MYTFKSNDFDYKIDSKTIQKIIDALYLLCMESDIGILINPKLKSFGVSKSFLEEINSEIITNIEEDYIGAKVVPSESKFISVKPTTIRSSLDFGKFEKLLNKYVGLKYQKSEKLLRAIEIYNSSNYLTIVNRPGRFILLMSAAEALIEQPEVSKRLQNSLGAFIKRVGKLKIHSEERVSILGSLSSLKKVSIMRSGKNLVEKLLDDDKKYNGFAPSEFFSKAYDLRSRFVHDGTTETKFLNIKTIQMQDFIKDMIQSYFKKICY
ncbi:MAG TPA: hypothetical protein VIH57_21760 [Bacteroidales bacterium]